MNIWKIAGVVLTAAGGLIQLLSYFVEDQNTQIYIKQEVAEQLSEMNKDSEEEETEEA